MSLCVAQDSWVSKAGMTRGRSGLGVAVVDGKIYAIGGASASGFCSINEQYDPAIGTWTLKESMPTSRSAFGIAVFEDRIYCMGGYSYSNQGGAIAVNEVYNPATDTWETKTPMPTPQLNVQANVIDGKIYVIGRTTNGTLNQVYDPSTDSWITKESIPTIDGSYASVAVGNKIYFFSSEVTQIYDVKNDSWSLGSSAPSRVFSGTAVATTGVFAPKRIYIFGDERAVWQLTTNKVITLSYDPETDRWTECPQTPTGRSSVGVAVVDDLLYVIGGFTTEFSSVGFNPNPTYMYSAANQQYTPIGYDIVAPKISIVSPKTLRIVQPMFL